MAERLGRRKAKNLLEAQPNAIFAGNVHVTQAELQLNGDDNNDLFIVRAPSCRCTQAARASTG